MKQAVLPRQIMRVSFLHVLQTLVATTHPCLSGKPFAACSAVCKGAGQCSSSRCCRRVFSHLRVTSKGYVNCVNNVAADKSGSALSHPLFRSFGCMETCTQAVSWHSRFADSAHTRRAAELANRTVYESSPEQSSLAALFVAKYLERIVKITCVVDAW